VYTVTPILFGVRTLLPRISFGSNGMCPEISKEMEFPLPLKKCLSECLVGFEIFRAIIKKYCLLGYDAL
jgi:hypothetical protein